MIISLRFFAFPILVYSSCNMYLISLKDILYLLQCLFDFNDVTTYEKYEESKQRGSFGVCINFVYIF